MKTILYIISYYLYLVFDKFKLYHTGYESVALRVTAYSVELL